jgi:flagella basal body P-ring formation protein FlgA
MLRAVLIGYAVLSALHAECVRVEGSYITAGDLAKASPEFRRLDPALIFSFAPPLGAQRTVSAPELGKWAASHGLAPATIPSACFERSSDKLRQEDVLSALRAVIGSQYDSARIDVVEICPCIVPIGRLEFELSGASSPPEERPETPILWRGRLITPDKHAYPVWVRARVLAAISLVRAASNLQRQQLLCDDDLEVFTAQASPLRFPKPGSTAAYRGKLLNVSVRQGTILQPSMVHSPSDVERGSVVRVEVVNGGAHLILTARAETAGNRGDLVTLTNPAGAARFRASVTGRGRAEIVFSPEPLRSAASGRNSQDPGFGSGGVL